MRTLLACALLAGASILPAHASFFSNPITGVNMNIGSAPNPTPRDLRAIGDSIYAFDVRRRNEPAPAPAGLSAMQGKMVVGPNGEMLGEVVGYDDLDKVLLIETAPAARLVVVSASALDVQGDRLVAPRLTPGRFAQLEASQGGRTAVYNEAGWARSRTR